MTRDYIEIVEQEFSLQRDGVTILRGHPDCVRVYESRRLVTVNERKYGYKEVQSADANLQLRCYLTLVAEVYPADVYYGCLVQPRVSSKPQIVRYTPDDIAVAKREIFAIHDACIAGTAPRRASNEACVYCEAQTVCPEFKTWAMAVTKAARLPVAQWSDADMDLFLSRRSLLEKFLKDVHEQIKQIKAADPERLPGWKLKPGANVRTVEDIVGAFGAMQSHLTAQEFSSACTLALGDVEKLVWKKHQDNPALGKLSQKDAKRLVDSVLASFIAKRRNKPSLEKDES